MNKRIMGFGGILLLGFAAFLDFTIVNTALPVIKSELNTSTLVLQWILNSYFLVLATSMVFAGKLADLYGNRRIFYIGSISFILGSLVAGCAMQSSVLILGRVLQAIGAAVIFPVAAALLREIYQEDNTKALGLYGAVGGIGLAVGPLLGAVLTSYFSWRAVFFINVPLGLLGVVLCLFSVPKSKPHPQPIDWLGVIFFMVGVAGIVIGIVNSAQVGFAAPSTLLYLVIGASCLFVLRFIEKKHPAPLIDGSILSKPLFLMGALANMMGGVSSGLFLFFVPLYLHQVRGESVLVTGLILFSITVSYAVFSPLMNQAMKRFGLVNSIIFGFVAVILAALLLFPLNLTLFVYWILLPCICVGFAWAVGNILSVIAAQQAVKESQVGVATGMVYTSFNIGGSIVLAIATAVFNNLETGYLHSVIRTTGASDSQMLHQLSEASSPLNNLFKQAFVNGFHGAVWVLLIAGCLALFLGLWLKTIMRKNSAN